MFESLIDNMCQDTWKELECDKKNQDEFKEYHVNVHHKQLDATTIGYMIAEEDGDAKQVVIKDVLPHKDPLKEVGFIEIRLSKDETEITGIDLNGDIIVRSVK